MNSKKTVRQLLILSLIIICFVACKKEQEQKQIMDNDNIQNAEAALNYLKELQGNWEVNGGDEGVFGWEFETTSRGNVVVERLKVGTPTEMTTVYNIDKGVLKGSHYCQLQNQPHLTAVNSETDGDLHFLCDGQVGNTQSHDELHMHGVHFKKKENSLLVWMDMVENGKVKFETKYELFRVIDSVKTK